MASDAHPGSPPRRRLPLAGRAELGAAVSELDAAVDDACEERTALAAEEGHAVACSRGCDACCHNAIMAWEPEAMAVADWLAKPENRPAREAFAAAYPA